MKKIILLIFMVLLFVPLVSAGFLSDLDNVLDYSEGDLNVSFSNSFFLLFKTSHIGTAKLLSHSSVDEVRQIGAGNQIVMWYDFDFKGLYENGLGEIEFTDVNTGEEIDRDYSFVYWGEEEYDIPTYSQITLVNGSKIDEQIGTKTKTRETWLPYNSNDIPKGKIRIGLQTYVEIGDKVDGVWTIAGKKVKKHAVWDESLSTNLVRYYNMDEIAGVVVEDSTQTQNGTGTNAGIFTGQKAGIINTSADLSTENYWIDFGENFYDMGIRTAMTISTWVNFTGTASGNHELLADYNGNGVLIRYKSTDELLIGVEGVGFESFTTTTSPATLGMHNMVIHWDSNNLSLYMDDAYVDSVATTITLGDSVSNVRFGAKHDGSNDFNEGDVDEYGVWNAGLSRAQITQLYNGGAGISWIGDFTTPPTIVLNAPADLSIVTNPNVIFNGTAKEDTALQNMSLIVNGSYISTNSTPYNNTLTQFPYALTSAGFWDWTIEACDSEGGCANATSRGITYQNDLAITLNAPPIMENFSISTFGLNGTPSDDTALMNISLIINATYNGTTNTPTNNTLINFDRTLADGFYNWTMEVCDVFGCLNATARNFTIDSTAPVLNIIYPTNTTYIDNFASVDNVTIQLNWSSTDLNLDSCWYYNTTNNVSLTCGDNATMYLPYGTHTFFVYANDTFGNENGASITATWTYNFLQTGSSYTAFGLETKNYSFVENISSTQTITSFSAFLNYNNTIYSADSSCSAGDCEILAKIDIPLIATGASSENISFFWQLSIFNGTGTSNVNTTTHPQNITAINFSECGTYPIAVNFTIHNESDRTALNANFDAYFKYYLGTGSVYKEGNTSQTGASVYDFCINQNETFFVTSNIDLSATKYENRHYNLVKKAYTNTTTIQPLYLLNSSVASAIIIEVKDQGLIPKKDVLVNISRFYSGIGRYVMIESQVTDEFGQILTKLIERDAKYKFAFYDLEGTLLKISEGITIACRSVYCIIPFVIEDVSDEFERFGNLTTYSYTFSFDNTTNIFTFSWDDQRGESTTTRLEVTRYLLNGTSIVCNTSSTSILSTLTCSVGSQRASYKAQVFRFVGGEKKRISLLNIKVSDPASIFGVEGLFWVFILLFTCIGIGAFNPSVAAGLYGMGFVIMGVLGIISMPIPVFFANTLLVIIFIWAVNK